jgi:hypothetical protein
MMDQVGQVAGRVLVALMGLAPLALLYLVIPVALWHWAAEMLRSLTKAHRETPGENRRAQFKRSP